MTEGIWVTIAFVTLLLLIAKPVKRALMGILDRYISDTRSTLKEAEDLKRQAAERLASAKEQLDESRRVAESILKRAQEEASTIVRDAKSFAEQEAKKQLSVVEKNFEARKQKLYSEIKTQAVDKAMADILQRFGNGMESEDEGALLDFGIKQFKKTVH